MDKIAFLAPPLNSDDPISALQALKIIRIHIYQQSTWNLPATGLFPYGSALWKEAVRNVNIRTVLAMRLHSLLDIKGVGISRLISLRDALARRGYRFEDPDIYSHTRLLNPPLHGVTIPTSLWEELLNVLEEWSSLDESDATRKLSLIDNLRRCRLK